MAVNLNLHIDQMDTITAFLQGELKHEIYMLQPEGFQQDQRVCRLNRSLYGLKQASRIWNEKLDQSLKDIGLERSKVDPCIYYDFTTSIS